MTLPLTAARNLGAESVPLDALRADLTDYGTPRIVLLPAPKRRRSPMAAPTEEGAPPPAQAPGRAREWPYYVRASVGNLRSTVVSGFFPGPALIRLWHYSLPNAGAAVGGLSLFWDTIDAGGATDVAPTTQPGGTPILDAISERNPGVADVDEIAQRLAAVGANNQADSFFDAGLRYVIEYEGPFTLKVSVRSGTTQTLASRGFVELITGIDLSRLVV